MAGPGISLLHLCKLLLSVGGAERHIPGHTVDHWAPAHFRMRGSSKLSGTFSWAIHHHPSYLVGICWNESEDMDLLWRSHDFYGYFHRFSQTPPPTWLTSGLVRRSQGPSTTLSCGHFHQGKYDDQPVWTRHFWVSRSCRYQLQGCRATACVAATIPTGACLVGKIGQSGHVWKENELRSGEQRWQWTLPYVWMLKMFLFFQLKMDMVHSFSCGIPIFSHRIFRFPGGHRSTHFHGIHTAVPHVRRWPSHRRKTAAESCRWKICVPTKRWIQNDSNIIN